MGLFGPLKSCKGVYLRSGQVEQTSPEVNESLVFEARPARRISPTRG